MTMNGSVRPDSPSRDLLPVATARRTWQLLKTQLIEHPGSVVWALVVVAAATASGLVAPWMLGVLVDVVDGGGDPSALWPIVAILTGAAILSAVLTGYGSVLVARVGNVIVARLRERVLHKTLHLPTATAERIGTGDLLSRVGDDVSEVAEGFTMIGPQVVTSLLMVLLTGAGLFALDWRLGLAGLVAIPAYGLALRWYLPRSAPYYADERVAMGERSHALIGSLQGADTVRTYRIETRHLDQIDRRSAAAMRLSIDVFAFFTRFASRNNRAECMGLLAVLVTGFFLVDAGWTTVGATTAAALYFHRLFNPLGGLVSIFDEIQSTGASLARLAGVIDMPEAAEVAEPESPGHTGLDIVDVSHRYDGGPTVVCGVDVTIEPGEQVALVGTSGAGKTTLAGIAAGVIEPTCGTVRLGGVPLSRLGDTQVRRRVTLLSQEIHVFSGTLAQDLRLAAPEATDAELEAALRKVDADAWVKALPAGVDTRVGDGAHRLTAAQAQQLALARVVLADPDVVVLDEATAEAGSAGARQLEAAAAVATAGRTTLVIAHRLTQAERADRIVVMDTGRIVETGSHRELLAADGRYGQLWRSWTGAERDPVA